MGALDALLAAGGHISAGRPRRVDNAERKEWTHRNAGRLTKRGLSSLHTSLASGIARSG